MDTEGNDSMADKPITVLVEYSSDDMSLDGSDVEDFHVTPNKCKLKDTGFIEKKDALSLLLTSQASITMVPMGPQVNRFFLLKDERNFNDGRRRKGRGIFLVDYVMNWQNLTSEKHYYLCSDGHYEYVDIVDGKFYTAPLSGIHRCYAPLQPSDPEKLMVVKEQYGIIPGKFKRRISYIQKLPHGVIAKQDDLILVEYLSDSLSGAPNGTILNSEFSKVTDLGTATSMDDCHETIDSTVEVTLGDEQCGANHAKDSSRLCDDSGLLDLPGVCKGEIRKKLGVENRGRFFGTSDVIEILLKAESDMMDIPPGHKENEYFVINNENNYRRNRAGKRRLYVDDCGAWKSVSIKKHHYTCVNGNYAYVDYVGGAFLFANSSTQRYGPIEKSKIFTLRKVYGRLKRGATYKRRISWVDEYPEGVVPKQLNLALVEYIGRYPAASLPHGNQKGPGALPYVRTPAGVMKSLKAKVATKTAKAVLRDLGGQDVSARDLKQLENLRYRSKLKIGPGSANDATHNENLHQIQSMVHEHPYVQQVICTKHQHPVIIAYTLQQMNALRYYCHNRSGIERIIGLDCTLMIGNIFLTTLLYTHPNLLCRKTSKPAIIMGPIFLHIDESWQTYSLFFNYLKGQISIVANADIDFVNIACRASEESATAKAMSHCFPHAVVSLCHNRLRTETERVLHEEVGLEDHGVKTVSDEIFSELIACGWQHDYNRKVIRLQSQYDSSLPQFSHYFSKLADNIRSSIWRPAMEEKHDVKWEVDDSKALKSPILLDNWEDLSLPALVLKLYSMAQLQEQDEVRALYGEGKYVLAMHAKKYAISKDSWQEKTNKQKARLLEGLRKFRAGACKPFVNGEPGHQSCCH